MSVNKIHDVEIARIKQKENSRVFYDDDDTAELMTSMRQNGLLSPVKLSPLSGDKYEVVFGNRRLVAAKKLGWKTIPSILENIKTDENFAIQNTIENMQRVDISMAEQGRIFKKLLMAGLTTEQISSRVGVQKRKVQLCLDVFTRIPKKYQKKVMLNPWSKKEGHIGAAQAITLTRTLSKIKVNEEEKEALFDYAAQNKINLETIKVVARLLTKGYSVNDAIKKSKGVFSISFTFNVDISIFEKIEKEQGSYRDYVMNYLTTNRNLGIVDKKHDFTIIKKQAVKDS